MFPALMGLFFIGWIAFSHPHWMLNLGMLNAVFGYSLLLFVLTPLGKRRMGTEADMTGIPSFISWFFTLISSQFAMLILFTASTVAFFGHGPALSQIPLSLNAATEVLQNYTFKQWGIFPWAIYGFWAFVINYLVYFKKRQPYFYQIGLDICPKMLESNFKNHVTLTCSGSIVLAIGISLAAAVLLIAYAFEHPLSLEHFKVPFMTVGFIYIGVIAFSFGNGRKLFRGFARHTRFLSKSILIMGLLFLVLLVLASFANRWFAQHYPQYLESLKCHQCTHYFGSVPAEIRLAAFYLGWWLMWVPIAGPYIAKISRGRTLREMMLGLLAVPSALFLIWVYQPAWIDIALNQLVSYATTDLGLIALGLGSIVILCRMLAPVKNIAWFYCGDFLPVEPHVKSRYRLKDGAKTMGFSLFYQRIGMTALAILLLHTVTGWYGIQFQLATLGFVTTEVMLMGFVFLIPCLIRDKALVGNIPVKPANDLAN